MPAPFDHPDGLDLYYNVLQTSTKTPAAVQYTSAAHRRAPGPLLHLVPTSLSHSIALLGWQITVCVAQVLYTVFVMERTVTRLDASLKRARYLLVMFPEVRSVPLPRHLCPHTPYTHYPPPISRLPS